MNIRKYSIEEARVRYEQRANENNSFASIHLSDHLYIDLREELIEIYNKLKKFNKGYALDLSFAIELHKIFTKKEWFTEVLSTDYSFWRYVCLEVIPDIIFDRHKDEKDYFYKKNVRLYPSTLFWYIHLFYKNSYEETFKFLSQKCFTTDTIMQTVERPGRKGINKLLYQEILDKYSTINKSIIKNTGESTSIILRKVLVQHTARSVVIIPECYKNGIKGYVDMLFNTVLEANK